jgi:release factor glutamine methyltransferase
VNSRQALEKTRLILEQSGIENPSLEGEILLRHILGVTRAVFFSELDRELTSAEKDKLAESLARRQTGEPSAYIIEHREFYGLDFRIDRRVLIPRPETELLVEKALDYCRQYKFSSIADIGTGSGCIAISLAVNLPETTIYAVDASLPALEIAHENIKAYHVKDRINLLWGNLLEPIPVQVDMIVANLPYVKNNEITSLFEPEIAFNGGMEGLDKINELCRQIPGKLKTKGILLMEVGQGQAETIVNNLHNIIPSSVIEITKDFAGIDRVVSLCLTS